MPVEFKDYYAALGVPRDASYEEIKKAFRKLARQYHHDVAKDKKTAEEKFKEINEAYEVLGPAETPEIRRARRELEGGRWFPAAAGLAGTRRTQPWRRPDIRVSFWRNRLQRFLRTILR